MASGGFGQVWTLEEDEQIRRLGPKIGAEKLARLLHRSTDGVRKRATRLKVSLRTGGQGKFWTPDEDAVLKVEVSRLSYVEIAAMLGRTPAGCEHRAKALGLVHKAKRRYAAPKQRKDGKRRCHDCGCLTTNYRCDKCWAKIRQAQDYGFEDEA